MKQVVVWGPPCAGKSTLVRDRMKQGDLRYDLDALDMALTARDAHTRQKGPGFGILLDFRADFIRKTKTLPGDGTAYIIASYLSEALTDLLTPDAEFIFLDVDQDECLRRLSQDDSRPDKDEWAELIREWFRKHERKGKRYMQYSVNKAAAAIKAEISDRDMAAINAQALKPLTPEEVFVFRCEACNDQPDRDFERFPLETIQALAPMFVGRTVICDHQWAAGNQTARIFAAYVEPRIGVSALMVSCYMIRNDATKDTIAAIEGGILREVSVGCAISRVTCSICGADAQKCNHIKGGIYDGKTCLYELRDPLDAYELSFVAVPAQPRAGVTKQTHNQGWTPAEMAAAKARLQIENERWK